ncbi:hypothetical protein VTO42DRAFT_8392 [Malbranchea cinnamomea]
MPMGTRRSHTKSRNGCIQCKARRIKCDERPSPCSNCARRQITCQYAPRVVSRTSPGGLSSSTTPTTLSPTSTATTSATSPSSIPPVSSFVTASGTGSLDLADLELLHHYTTSTYKTLPSGAAPDQHELWQIQVVQVGFQHEFLLRGILAVSALHLAYLRPMRREALTLQASTHQSIAIQLFHEALNRVSTSNCVALFSFSCIIVALTFAAPKPTGPDCAGVQKEILDWFHMVRGCNSVLQTQWETLSRSFLAPLLKKGMMHETAPTHSVRDTVHITGLLRLCSSEPLARDSDAANGYALAIHELLNAYTQVSVLMERKQDFVPVIFVWPVTIPQSYLVHLSECRPEAMVILAHYAALLQRVDDQWYMKGWAHYLVKQIDSALDEGWKPWLSWPKEVTGFRVVAN